MAYIGKEPADSFISFAKQDFTTSATTSYTLDNAVTNENELALFINFVRQEPTTAYTASGTTLTLTSATASTDDMYCVYLGQAKQTVNAPDGSVGSSQVASTIITGQTAETSIATDDTVLIHDTSAGALRKMTRANFVSGIGGTNTPMFHAYLGSNQSISSGTETKVALDQEAIDTDNAFASNKFTVPSGEDGKYYIEGSVSLGNTDGNTSTTGFCFVTLHKNGTNIGGDQRIDPRNNNGSAFSIQISAILDLSAGDYIELFGSGQISSAQHFYGGTGAVARTYLLGYKLIT